MNRNNLLRNLLLILFFVPFFVAQDAHYLNYLHCRLVNIAQPVSQHCDCEQLLNTSKKDQSPINGQPATHVHAHLDVYFHHTKSWVVEPFVAPGEQPAYIFALNQVCTGFNLPPWRPPAFHS